MALPLAPYRQDKKVFPTPLVGDVLFSELVDTGRMELPEYGTAHPNTHKWPNHRLVYIEEGNTDREGVFRFYYAADREYQDEYNFSHTKADIGGAKFDAVARSYLVPRADYSESTPALGSAMPDTPAGLFESGYILAERQQRRVGQQELDSLYVAFDCVYIKRVALVKNDYDEAFGGNLSTVQRLYYAGETISGNGRQKEFITVLGSVNPATSATAVLTLLFIPIEGDQFTVGSQTYVYKDVPVDPNDIQIGDTTAQTLLNTIEVFNSSANAAATVEFTDDTAITFTSKLSGTAGNSIDTSGTFDEPTSGISAFSGGANGGGGNMEIVVAATGFSTQTVTFAVAAGDSAQDVAAKACAALQANTTVAARFNVSQSGPTIYLESLTGTAAPDASFTFSLKAAVSSGATGITNVNASTYVSGTGVSYSDTVENLFANPNSPFWGLQPNGVMREGQQLSANWYAITERQVIPETIATTGRTYYSTSDFSWPAVLTNIRRDDWELREGGEDRYVFPEYKREAYRGPCRIKIQETFHAAPPVALSPQTLLPLPVQIATPFLSFSDGPSLHNGFTLTFSTGNNHPKYRYTVGIYSFPATNFTDWPTAGLRASDEVKPFRGGYLRTVVTVYPPA